MDERTDLYAILGVTPDASAATIRKAYHERARAAHPDLVGDLGLTTMRRLNAAWSTLRDPVRRAEYDVSRAVASPAAPTAASQDAARAGEPEWTGAAGPPPGRPSGSRLPFGLYAGWTIGEVARHDNGYLMWLAERREGRPYAAEIRAILTPAQAAQAEAKRRNLGWRR